MLQPLGHAAKRARSARSPPGRALVSKPPILHLCTCIGKFQARMLLFGTVSAELEVK